MDGEQRVGRRGRKVIDDAKRLEGTRRNAAGGKGIASGGGG